MKTFSVATIAGIASASINPTDVAYMQHVATFGRNIQSVEEFTMRSALFAEADQFITQENMKNLSYKVGHNHMSDWTEAEYKSLLGYKPELQSLKSIMDKTVVLDTKDIPASVDWVAKGAVTPIKDQKTCGSCWAFSTTGSMEGAHFLKGNELLSFSEQQLVDCSKENHGCAGGLMDNAFKFFETNSTELEKDYPYTAKDGTCS